MNKFKYIALQIVDGEYKIILNENVIPREHDGYILSSKYDRWKSNHRLIDFITNDDKSKVLEHLENICFDEQLNEPYEIDCIEIIKTCIQTGAPCGMTCFGEDTCNNSLYAYFKVPIDENEDAKDKRIKELEKAIQGALNCRDLWGNANDISEIEECYRGEAEILAGMESEFKRLLATK